MKETLHRVSVLRNTKPRVGLLYSNWECINAIISSKVLRLFHFENCDQREGSKTMGGLERSDETQFMSQVVAKYNAKKGVLMKKEEYNELIEQLKEAS